MKSFLKSEYFRNAATLLSGNVLAQILMVVLLPVLSRIYSPEHFGVYSAFLAVISVMVIAATGRYELAIMLQKKEEEAFKFAALSTRMVVGVTFLFALLLLALYSSGLIAQFYDLRVELIFFLPLGLFIHAAIKPVSYLNNFLKSYKRMSFSKMTGSITNGLVSLVLGWTGWLFTGLIVGKILGWLVEYLNLLLPIRKAFAQAFINNRLRFSYSSLKQYANFPKYSIPEGLINMGFKQIPVLAVTAYFSLEMAGQLGMANSIISLPITVLSMAFGQVFFQKASQLKPSDTAAMQKLVLNNTGFLLAIATIPTVILMIWGPQLFVFVLGDKWFQAGKIARWIMPFYFVTLTKAPISSLVDIKNKIHRNILFEIGYLLLTCTAFFLAWYFDDATLGIQLFGVSCAVLGVFQWGWFYSLCRVGERW